MDGGEALAGLGEVLIVAAGIDVVFAALGVADVLDTL